MGGLTDNYGDDPNVADFGDDVGIEDIRFGTREVTLTCRQQKVTKTVSSEIRR